MSAVWTDDADTLSEFVRSDASTKYECSCTGAACNKFNNHKMIRPNKGEEGRADRGSIYPDGLCQMLVRAAQTTLAKVRAQLLDPAMTNDGTENLCRTCGKGGKLYLCAFCPAAYHYRCIPRVALRPNTKLNVWACPDCHAKGKGPQQVMEPGQCNPCDED